uniref:Sodium-coupled neutral amino acid transporter 7-like n=1 Tax=Saccoglossus kowalevskii TaxID=10224 RepID=A0ABM0MY10_SACKO|nr:PREDICTED: putative sodium-coupled neutral amino acid transporter 7-like [Saccoglossus kowalevskii]
MSVQASLNDSVSKVYVDDTPDHNHGVYSWSTSEARTIDISSSFTESTRENNAAGKNSVIGASIIMIKACCGAGMLAFPATFGAAGGIVVTIIMQVVFSIFSCIGLIVLAYCSSIHNTSTFELAIASLCGHKTKMAALVLVMVYGLGGCITFLVILGDQLDEVMILFSDVEYFCNHWYLQRRLTISVTSILFILPLCIPAKMEFLKYSRHISLLSRMLQHLVVKVEFPLMQNMAVVVTCHLSSVPIYCTLKKKTVGQYAKVVIPSMAVIFTLYAVIGIYGYLTFGDSVNSDILLSYGYNDIRVTVARIMITISLLTVYPILHFCARAALQGMLKDCGGVLTYIIMYKEKYFRLSATILWFSVTLVVALFIPSIGMVISVAGAFAAAFMLFFPGLCFIQCGLQGKAKTKQRNNCLLALGVVYTVFGAFVFGESLSMAILNDVHGTYPGAKAASQCP